MGAEDITRRLGLVARPASRTRPEAERPPTSSAGREVVGTARLTAARTIEEQEASPRAGPRKDFALDFLALFELLARFLLGVMPETETAWSLLAKGARWTLDKTLGVVIECAIKTAIERRRPSRRQAPPEDTTTQQ
ncbi:hypothetical protein ACWDFL_37345 [Streptomyces bungoensis]